MMFMTCSTLPTMTSTTPIYRPRIWTNLCLSESEQKEKSTASNNAQQQAEHRSIAKWNNTVPKTHGLSIRDFQRYEADMRHNENVNAPVPVHTAMVGAPQRVK